MLKTILSIVLLLPFLGTGCKTTSTYHEKLDELQSLDANHRIEKFDFISQRIDLDRQRGVEWSEKWNAVMLRNESMESVYDPMMHAVHVKLINEALQAREISTLEAGKLRRMAEAARTARGLRSQKRMIQRTQLRLRK